MNALDNVHSHPCTRKRPLSFRFMESRTFHPRTSSFNFRTRQKTKKRRRLLVPFYWYYQRRKLVDMSSALSCRLLVITITPMALTRNRPYSSLISRWKFVVLLRLLRRTSYGPLATCSLVKNRNFTPMRLSQKRSPRIKENQHPISKLPSTPEKT